MEGSLENSSNDPFQHGHKFGLLKFLAVKAILYYTKLFENWHNIGQEALLEARSVPHLSVLVEKDPKYWVVFTKRP